MSALRNSIVANYAGQAWMALMAVAFVPLYIRVLGMESFGLIGLMLSIQALSMVLDLGMGGVLNRELARRTHEPTASQTRGDLVRTFECLLWPAALLIALGVWLGSGPLANHWLQPQALSRAEAAHAFAIMGLAVALQWPSSFYSNGLSGLERQRALNLINALFATLRGAGVLVVLGISPTISAFMWWYAAMGACQSLVSAAILWRSLPSAPGCRPRYRSAELRAAWRFAGGLVAITALSTAVTQLDRVVLSAMRPLEELGYFSLALSVAAGLGRLIQPMFNALYPRYSRLVFLGKTNELTYLYHLSNQCLAVVVAATSVVLIFFSRDVLYLWTGDTAIAIKAALPLSILVGGTALHGLLNLPYALQLANGWTRLGVASNLVALILGIPLCIWAVGHYGIVGAACLWLAVNLGSITIGIPLMHRRLLPGEMGRWYLHDVLPPFLAATATGGLCRWLAPALSRNIQGMVQLVAISSATLLAAAMMSPATRSLLKNTFTRVRAA